MLTKITTGGHLRDLFQNVRKRRMYMTVCIILLTILFIVWTVWSLLLPHYRPSLRPGEVYGIDVSEHQKSVTWSEVAGDGISFAYIKASEGSSTQDARFHSYWNGAQRAGLRVGAYHYFSLCSSGKTQAKNFLRTVSVKDSRMLPPVLDLELSPFCKNEPDQKEVIRQIEQFVHIVEEGTGEKVILYVGDHFDKKYSIKSHYPKRAYWQLRYLQRPNDPQARLWQVGYFFTVKGISEKVDLNVGRIYDL